jgi:hypothetical protein
MSYGILNGAGDIEGLGAKVVDVPYSSYEQRLANLARVYAGRFAQSNSRQWTETLIAGFNSEVARIRSESPPPFHARAMTTR